jgi:hypothetical protein
MRLFKGILSYLHELMLDDKRRLIQFSISAVVFFIWYAMIHWADKNLPPSLDQEIAALIFITVGLSAFFWAILLQLLYILSRLFK